MKKITKAIALAVAVTMMALALTACGGGSGGSSAGIKSTFTTITPSWIDAMNWYTDEVYMLEINTDNTYQLIYHTDRFGGEDLDMRGVRTITYTGKCTTAASADGEPSHLDVSLEAPTQITWEQHGKGFSRVETLPGTFFINTSSWTDAMGQAYDPEGSGKGAAEFLAEFGKAMTITVEDPTVDLEDTTLSARIVTLPDLGISYGEEG